MDQFATYVNLSWDTDGDFMRVCHEVAKHCCCGARLKWDLNLLSREVNKAH